MGDESISVSLEAVLDAVRVQRDEANEDAARWRAATTDAYKKLKGSDDEISSLREENDRLNRLVETLKLQVEGQRELQA